MFRSHLILLAGVVGLGAAWPLDARTWTDRNGRVVAEAELVEVKEYRVRLKRTDGRELVVPLVSLSDADRQFVAEAGRAGVPAGDRAEGASAAGLELGEARASHWKVGVVIRSSGPAARSITATTPVPMDWPEQQVKIVKEYRSPQVRGVRYQVVQGGAKLMVVSVPRLEAGQTAEAWVELEVQRRPVTGVPGGSELRLSDNLDIAVRSHLAPSPQIESDHAEIRDAAARLAALHPEPWRRVKSYYDWVRSHLKYQEGPLQGALAALRGRQGDCEEFTSLFVAMCRASGIPARSVWVPGHCYAEFHLQDAAGRGVWVPADPTLGEPLFGRVGADALILQKGDRFTFEGLGGPLRYLNGSMTGHLLAPGHMPAFEQIREILGGDAGRVRVKPDEN